MTKPHRAITAIKIADTGSPALHKLIDKAIRTTPKHAREIVARCLELLPHYQQLAPEILRVIHANVHYHIGLFYRLILEERGVTPDELEPARRVARERARQGVPLGELFTFYQAGFTMVWEELMAEGGRDPELRSQLLERMAALVSSHTQVTTATADAYVEERERLSRFSEQELDDLARLILTADAPATVLENRARAVGLPLDQPLQVLAFSLPVLDAESQDAIQQPVGARRHIAEWLRPAGGVVGRCHQGFVAVVPAASVPDDIERFVATTLGGDVRVGIGGKAEDVSELYRSAREGVRAVRVGSIVAAEGRLFRYRDFAIFDLLRVGSEDAEAFARGVLGPLAEPDASPTVLTTLRALCLHDFRVKLAAATLSIHPNTLAYRMRQIRERFGIEMEGANARLHVHLALLIRDGLRALTPKRS